MGGGVCVWEGDVGSRREEGRGDGGGEGKGSGGEEVKSDFKAHGSV